MYTYKYLSVYAHLYVCPISFSSDRRYRLHSGATDSTKCTLAQFTCHTTVPYDIRPLVPVQYILHAHTCTVHVVQTMFIVISEISEWPSCLSDV